MKSDATAPVPFRSGFVAVVGQPNVGKSTLINALLGTKVSIVSPKAQTTRNRIHGIYNAPTAQVVLVDTPGFCAARGPLTRALRRTAGAAAVDGDVTLLMLQPRGPLDAPVLDPADSALLGLLASRPERLVLALNKVDILTRKEVLLPWMAELSARHPQSVVVPISARRREGLDVLLDALVARLPPGPALFPTDMHTDQAERFLCAELIREALLFATQDEVPHSCVVTIEDFLDERDDPSRPMCHLEARIFVERDSQKGILIGKAGQQIRAIGAAARRRIEELLDCQVYLRLTAHVDRCWSTNERALRRYGLAGELGAATP